MEIAREIQVFLEQDVVPYLEDKLLDAEVTGEEVRFTVEAQDGA